MQMDIKTFCSTYLLPKKINKVRIGANHDGGYVLPEESLNECDCCLSYGLAREISFERSYRAITNKTLFGFDASVHYPNSNFFPEYLKSYDQFKNHCELISNRIKNLNPKILVKMDIEGDEWGILDEMNVDHFKSVVHTFAIEIHLKEDTNINTLFKLFEDFNLVHIHLNNCSKIPLSCGTPKVLELTFINKKYSGGLLLDKQTYPINLIDYKNCPENIDQKIPWIL
jgi:hypothetical protein